MLDIKKYNKTNWEPTIIDPITGEVISKGTRFTSGRANNFEEGIYDNRELHRATQHTIKRMQVQLELISRVPTGSGAFYDTITEEENSLKGIEVIEDTRILSKEEQAGNREIELVDTTEIVGGDYILLDDTGYERVFVDTIEDDIVELKSPLLNSYKKGAFLVKSFGEVREESLENGEWSTYSVDTI